MYFLVSITATNSMLSRERASMLVKSEWEKSFESILYQTRQTLKRINHSSPDVSLNNKSLLSNTTSTSTSTSYQSNEINSADRTASSLNLQSNLLDRIMDRLRNLETTKQINRDGETLHLQNKISRLERTIEDLQFQVKRNTIKLIGVFIQSQRKIKITT